MIKQTTDKICNYMNLQGIRPKFPRAFDKDLMTLKRDNLVGVEIGVDRAEHACYLLGLDKVKFMYLIDPYKPMPSKKQHYSKEDIEGIKKVAYKNLARFEGKYKLIEKTSDEALKEIPFVDFVYIDGDHSYKQVKKDIKNYYPLVRKGGLFGGDDFKKNKYFNYRRVIEAVIEFVEPMGYDKLNVIGQEWWVFT